MPVENILYSEKYSDDQYEYRHVILPPDLAKLVPKQHLMTETEWRNLGVQQSPNWVHYMLHTPEPHVLLFRRPIAQNSLIGGVIVVNHPINCGVNAKIEMPILYSVVSRGNTVLARYASCAGNFAEVTEQIIGKIPPHNDKLTYSHGNYLFHYISENGIIYMCITDDEFERSRAFLFLNEIKRRFQSLYADTAGTAIAYAMNTDFSRVLANEMKHYSESRDVDTISRVHGELDELKNIMVKNIDNVAMRGERLELLVNKAENLNSGSISFRKTSRNLARSMFWKNVKLYVIIGCIIAVIVYFIISMACGGLLWQGCLAKK